MDKLREIDSTIQILPLQANVASEKEVDDAIKQTVDKFGRIDVAVNVAGIGGANFRTSDCDLSEWRKVMDINIDGVWRCQRAELRAMLQQAYAFVSNRSKYIYADVMAQRSRTTYWAR